MHLTWRSVYRFASPCSSSPRSSSPRSSSQLTSAPLFSLSRPVRLHRTGTFKFQKTLRSFSNYIEQITSQPTLPCPTARRVARDRRRESAASVCYASQTSRGTFCMRATSPCLRPPTPPRDCVSSATCTFRAWTGPCPCLVHRLSVVVFVRLCLWLVVWLRVVMRLRLFVCVGDALVVALIPSLPLTTFCCFPGFVFFFLELLLTDDMFSAFLKADFGRTVVFS